MITNDPKTYRTREVISSGGRVNPVMREPRKLSPAQQAAIAAAFENAGVDDFVDFAEILKDAK